MTKSPEPHPDNDDEYVSLKDHVIDYSTGILRFTQQAKERLRKSFATVGVNIDDIKSREQLIHATHLRFVYKMSDLAQHVKGKNPLLDEIMRDMPGWQDE